MVNNNVAAIAELSNAELDLVAAGSLIILNNIANVSVPVAINVGVLLANQSNIAVFSIAHQGGTQTLSLRAIAIA